MATTALKIEHIERPDGGRFEARVGGGTVELDYDRGPDSLEFHHTGTSPSLRGRGLAGEVVEHGLSWAATQGLRVIPSCSYTAQWLQRHPRWQRLLAPTRAQAVLTFWFGAMDSTEDGQMRKQWFIKDEAFDAEIRERFGADIDAGLNGGLQSWLHDDYGRLACIVLLDQFTRNAHRGTPKSFAGDPLARREALALLDAGKSFDPLMQSFVLLPLEHAEDMALQDSCVSEFEKLAERDARTADYLNYARRHREVIERFGRFPHRNAILGRESTPEELAYLAQPGSGF